MSQIKRIFSNKASVSLHPLSAEPGYSALLPKVEDDYNAVYQLNTELWDASEWNTLIDWLKNKSELKTEIVCFCGTQKVADDAWDFIYSQFHIIEAAGGLVKNQDGKLLMIFRKGFWDLPKGKLDAGESLESCALREVKEETGVHPLFSDGFIGLTYHIYLQSEEWILKESYWYNMHTNFTAKLKPQLSEDITRASWVSLEELPDLYEKMYPLIECLVSENFE